MTFETRHARQTMVVLATIAMSLPTLAACAQEPRARSTPQASFTWDPFSPPYYATITFDGSASTDADGEIVSYLWDLGDGTTVEGAIVQHVYQQNGNFTIQLTVIDNDGLSHARRVDLPITDTYR